MTSTRAEPSSVRTSGEVSSTSTYSSSSTRSSSRRVRATLVASSPAGMVTVPAPGPDQSSADAEPATDDPDAPPEQSRV